MKILSIDDQPLILLSLQKRLIELGYDVQIADSGQKGIELFKSFQPSLVILDINMPDMSGLEVAEKIREVQEWDVPIMIMSGNINDDVLNRGMQLGIQEYMKKPVSLLEVESRVERLLNASNEESLTKKLEKLID